MCEQHGKDKEIERAVKELLDREAIRDVINRFAIAADRRDWEMMASCFTADAYFDSLPLFQGSVAECIPAFQVSLGNFASTMHFSGTQLIELQGDKARGETYSIDYHRLNGEGEQKDMVVGLRFCDDLVRQGAEWLIQRREVKLMWQREDTVVLMTGL